MNKKVIGEAIFKLRNYAGLTQDELLPKQRANISSIELGKTNASLETIQAICEKIEIPMSIFFMFVEYLSLKDNTTNWKDDVEAINRFLEL